MPCSDDLDAADRSRMIASVTVCRMQMMVDNVPLDRGNCSKTPSSHDQDDPVTQLTSWSTLRCMGLSHAEAVTGTRSATTVAKRCFIDAHKALVPLWNSLAHQAVGKTTGELPMLSREDVRKRD